MRFTKKNSEQLAIIYLPAIAAGLLAGGCGGGGVGKSNTFDRTIATVPLVDAAWVRPVVLVLPFENGSESGGAARQQIHAFEKFHFPVQLTRFLKENRCLGNAYYSPVKADSADYYVTGTVLESDGENVRVNVQVAENSGQLLWSGHLSIQLGYNDFSRHYDPSSMIWVEALNKINQALADSWPARQPAIAAKKAALYGASAGTTEAGRARLEELYGIERDQILKPISELSQRIDSTVGDVYIDWQKDSTRFSQLAMAQRAERINDLTLSYSSMFAAAATKAVGQPDTGFSQASVLASQNAEASAAKMQIFDASIDKLNDSIATHVAPITITLGSKVQRLAGSLTEQLLELKRAYFPESAGDTSK